MSSCSTALQPWPGVAQLWALSSELIQICFFSSSIYTEPGLQVTPPPGPLDQVEEMFYEATMMEAWQHGSQLDMEGPGRERISGE